MKNIFDIFIYLTLVAASLETLYFILIVIQDITVYYYK